MNIYVANLPLATDEDSLRKTFSAYGEVSSVNIVRDRASGTSRGFGFVTMPIDKEAEAAIGELNGKEMEGRAITVEKSRSKPGGPRRSGGERGRGGGPRPGGRGGPRRGGGDGGSRRGDRRGSRY